MVRTLASTALILLAGLVLSDPAEAQFPAYGSAYGPAMPMPGGPALPGSSPLSPYLNLLGRNASVAVSYYNFTRPATIVGGPARVYSNAMFGPRQTFIPQYGSLLEEEPADPFEPRTGKAKMPPAGHPAGFNVTFGYLPQYQTPGAGAARPGTFTAPRRGVR